MNVQKSWMLRRNSEISLNRIMIDYWHIIAFRPLWRHMFEINKRNRMKIAETAKCVSSYESNDTKTWIIIHGYRMQKELYIYSFRHNNLHRHHYHNHHPRCKFHLEKLIFAQSLKKLQALYEPEDPLPCRKQHTAGLHLEPGEFTPHSPIMVL